MSACQCVSVSVCQCVSVSACERVSVSACASVMLVCKCDVRCAMCVCACVRVCRSKGKYYDIVKIAALSMFTSEEGVDEKGL